MIVRAAAAGSKFNYAHDYIINDILRAELGFASISAGGLDMPGARERSAEDIVIEMRRNADLMPSRTQVFEGAKTSIRQVLGAGSGHGDQHGRRMTRLATSSPTRKSARCFRRKQQDQATQKAEIDAITARGLPLAATMAKHSWDVVRVVTER